VPTPTYKPENCKAERLKPRVKFNPPFSTLF
jgi:hypothetical protein